MKIEHLREFVTCARLGNVTAAARQLYLSQSALSKHLANLEQEIGLSLLDRTTHAVTLTPAGSVALELFARVVDDYDRAADALALLKDGATHQVRLGFLLHSLDNDLYQATRAIATSLASWRVSVHFGDADELTDGLGAGSFDACLLLGVDYPLADLQFRPISSVPLLVLAIDGDPLCEVDSIRAEHLAGRKLVLPSGQIGYAEIVKKLLSERLGIELTVAYSDQKSTELFTVRESGGVAIISSLSRKRLPEGAHAIPFADPDIALDIGWLYRSPVDTEEKKALEAFLDTSAELLARYDAL